MGIQYKDGNYYYDGCEIDFTAFDDWQEADYDWAGIRFIEPMGAKDVMEKDIDKLFDDPDYYVDEKLDGGRCTMHINTLESFLFSRNLVKKSNWLGNYSSKVPHLSYIGSSELEGTILDGELMIPDQPCNVTSGTLNCLAEESFRRQYFEVGFAELFVFDIICYKGSDVTHLPMIERRKLANEVVAELGSEWIHPVACFNTCINLIKADNTTSTMTKREYYNYIVANGGEGVMFKHKDGDYVLGKKGRQFQKMKKVITRDVIITGFGLPTKEYEGKFPNDFWLYWEDEKGKKVDLEEVDSNEWSASDLKANGWTPVTKFYYMGWIGTIKFDVISPNRTNNKMKLGIFKTRDPMMNDEYIYNTVHCGECKGITEEVAILLSKDISGNIGRVMEVECNGVYNDTGMLRHPRFKQFRDDKCYLDCTWENHLEG